MLIWLIVKTGRAAVRAAPQKGETVGVLNVILVVVLVLSGLATAILILMHSGKGTGVSELIASSMYNAAAGSGIWEKNLDRLTVITSVIFIVCVLVMALTFPLGSI